LILHVVNCKTHPHNGGPGVAVGWTFLLFFLELLGGKEQLSQPLAL
jgi:hypothetical protein